MKNLQSAINKKFEDIWISGKGSKDDGRVLLTADSTINSLREMKQMLISGEESLFACNFVHQHIG